MYRPQIESQGRHSQERCDAYIKKSRAHEGWRAIPGRYDDGAFSGASLECPALQQLLAEVRAGKIDIVLVCFREDQRRPCLLWTPFPG
jgi:DNA invertase Pin-like site-specific DNA recombinase